MVTEKSAQRGRKTHENANGEGTVYFDKSKKLWYAEITAGYDPKTGKRIAKKSHGFKVKADAAQAQRGMLTALDQGIGRNEKTERVGNYLDRWLAAVERDNKLEPKTKENYRYCVSLVTPKLRGLALDKLTPDQVDDFFSVLQETGGIRSQGVSARTAQNVRAVLGIAFKRAEGRRSINFNPLVHSEAISVKREPVEPFSEEEANLILDTVHDRRLEALYHVALYLGLREGELLGLRWQDVDLEKRVLRVRQQVQQQQKGKPFIKELKTSRSRRDIELPEELVTVLRAHQDRMRMERRDVSNNAKNETLVFCSAAGTPMWARNLITNYTNVLKRAGLKHRGFHHLRHTAATTMFGRGLSLVEVSRILGHEKITTTADLYVHWIPVETARLSAAMDGFRQASRN
ncbi:MAG TPA: tyrosine-type recombinase/integrase [Thermomicrobiales bacterium]|jgi:integrase